MSDLVVRHVGRLTSWRQPVVADAAVVIRDGRVAWTGTDSDLPAGIGDLPELDAAGAAVLPGFVDCHTHAVWAGSRRADFVGRLGGGGYRPGGIATTVAATREAPYDVLLDEASRRVRTMQQHGTTTVEMKSGYGLTVGDECRLLDVIADVASHQVVAVEATYLGAHVVPPERDRDDYVREVVETLPAAKRHGARWCDVFCDDGAFTVDEARRILTAARDVGLGLRIHAEQLARTGAAELAAELQCASADHLEQVDEPGARALADAGVVAVLVPVVSLYTRSGDWGHAATLAAAGCELAVATDCNPGSAWCESMPYAVQLACLAMGLPVDVALRAATLGGAHALRLADAGHLGAGARGDLVVLATEHEADLVAHLGVAPVARTVVGGTPIG
ncbi:MAG TPA: imidazolonepropionase [Mycobacteriales bacterium]|nr:imidazolonepropionase [Mycobacteriales bacterium]